LTSDTKTTAESAAVMQTTSGTRLFVATNLPNMATASAKEVSNASVLPVFDWRVLRLMCHANQKRLPVKRPATSDGTLPLRRNPTVPPSGSKLPSSIERVSPEMGRALDDILSLSLFITSTVFLLEYFGAFVQA
jgi:hypothetical protein